MGTCSNQELVCYSKWGKLNNFEFIMNRAYALNRDRLKCRVCGGWLISVTPCTHRVNPYLPLNQVNRVNNLVSMHKKCLDTVNNPKQDISNFEAEAQKKNKGFRDRLVISHMERFWGILKRERYYGRKFTCREQLSWMIREYIIYYNFSRL